jgi:hypothetical protein
MRNCSYKRVKLVCQAAGAVAHLKVTGVQI